MHSPLLIRTCCEWRWTLILVAIVPSLASQPPAFPENPCLMDLDPGPCYGHFTKFFYNSSRQECQVFLYSGCYGNQNRFDTLPECTFVCVDNSWPPYPITEQPDSADAVVMVLNPDEDYEEEIINFQNDSLGQWVTKGLLVIQDPESDTNGSSSSTPSTTTTTTMESATSTTSNPTTWSPTTLTTVGTTTAGNATTTAVVNTTSSPTSSSATLTTATSSTMSTTRMTSATTSTTSSTSTTSTRSTTMNEDSSMKRSLPDPELNFVLANDFSESYGTLSRRLTFSADQEQHLVLEFSIRLRGYAFPDQDIDDDPSNPSLVIRLVQLDDDDDDEDDNDDEDATSRQNSEDGESSYSLFELKNVSRNFMDSTNKPWDVVRLTFFPLEGNFSLIFNMSRGMDDNRTILLDDVTLRWYPEMKNNTQLYNQWLSTSTSSPSTTAASTTTMASTTATTTWTSTWSNGTSTIMSSSSSSSTSSTSQSSSTTKGPITEHPPETSTASTTAIIVLVCLLVLVTVVLIGLAVKHCRTLNKLKQYHVQSLAAQDYDNPLFHGATHRRSADRF